MKKWIYLIFFVSITNAMDLKTVIDEYKAGNFDKACFEGMQIYYGGEKSNEELLALVGDACAKSDNINSLSYLQKRLVSTKQSRETASYFATLILQKKLIYQFIMDEIKLDHLKLPKTGQILSIVFENLSNNNYQTLKPKKIKIQTKKADYILWADPNIKRGVFIDEYDKKGTLIKRHWYL